VTDPAIQNLVTVLLEHQRVRMAGGLERFLKNLSTQVGQESWRAWRADPVTCLVVDALKAMVEVQPRGYDATTPTGLALAHGALCGASLAAKLIDDPTSVFPSIFDGEEKLRKAAEAPANLNSDGYTAPPATEAELE
jgi:hypothetical protein